MKRLNKFWQMGIGAVFLVLVVGSAYMLLGRSDIVSLVGRAGIWAPLLLISLKAATIIISPLGGTPIYFAVPKLFHPLAGFLYLCIADVIGYSVVFWISRLFGRRVMAHMLSDEQIAWMDRMLRYMQDWKGLTIMRIVFFPLADTISYAAGLTKMPYRTYMLVTAPLLILHAAVATTFARRFVTNQHRYLYIVIAIMVIPVVFYLFRRQLKKILPKRILGRIPFILPEDETLS